MSGKDESNMRRKQGDGGWVAAEAAAPAPQAERQNRVQCKCGAWFDQAEFESHGRTCGAGEMTADAELDEMIRDFCVVGPKPKSEVRRRILAYAKQRVEQAERQVKWLTIQTERLAVACGKTETDNSELRAKVSDLERERDEFKESTYRLENTISLIHLEHECTLEAAELKLKAMREALRKLSNEVSGILSLERYRIREIIGNTNSSVLQLRLDEARRLSADQ